MPRVYKKAYETYEQWKEGFFNQIYFPFDCTDDDCWEWMAGKESDGYGLWKKFDRVTARAHKLAYCIWKGLMDKDGNPLPLGGILCHTCGCRACCNPHHMYIGTHGTNAVDRENHGNGGKKRQLTISYTEILKLKEQGKSVRDIAYEFGIKPVSVYMAIKRKQE